MSDLQKLKHAIIARLDDVKVLQALNADKKSSALTQSKQDKRSSVYSDCIHDCRLR